VRPPTTPKRTLHDQATLLCWWTQPSPVSHAVDYKSGDSPHMLAELSAV